MNSQPVPCPFVYANGKQCTGHVVRIEAFKADLEWKLDGSGNWKFGWTEPRSHFHVYCSEKDGHALHGKPDNNQMKFYANELPAELLAVIHDEVR